MMELTGVILSGGKSSRMGENKAFMKVQGERLIDRAVRIFKGLFAEVILVTNSPLDYLDQDVMIVTDILPGKGPLGGIYTGLFYSSHSHSFVAACDMPFLDEGFIRFMINQADARDVVIPETKKGLQPLHALYSRNCLSAARKLIDEDILKVEGLYRMVKIHRLKDNAIGRFDPRGRMFINVNSRDDLEKILSEV